jgi:E3 ubiquitin-protein ligase RNF115/126
MDDVVSTLDDSENDKLKVYRLIEKKEEKCSICMCDINIDEEVCDLPCTHTFHNECIQPWLKNYNYKCPVCRKEVGKPKYNI